MTSKGKGLKEQVSSVCVSHGRRLTPPQESRGNYKEMLHTASRYPIIVERSNIADSDQIYQSAMQDLAKLNPAELTPLTPEVISRQATINIGRSPI